MFTIRLKQLRKEAGLTQKQVANNLNISQSAYAQWETGKLNPKKETVQNFANFFNVSTDYLLGKSDSRTSSKDIQEAINNSVAYNGKEIDDYDREVISNFLKEYFDNKNA